MHTPNSYLKSLTVFLVVAISLLTNSSTSHAKGGFDGVGGGNVRVADFYEKAKTFNAVMTANGAEIDATFPTGKLNKVVAKLKVTSVKRPLELRGAKVDAINNWKTGSVTFDNSSWDGLKDQEKYELVVHELLGLLRIADPQYDVSRRLARDSKKFLTDGRFVPAKKQSPATEVNQCPSGQIFSSQYGCLLQCPGQPGLVMVNGQCISAASQCPAGQVYTQYGCLQQCPQEPKMGYYPQTGQCVLPMPSGAYGQPYYQPSGGYYGQPGYYGTYPGTGYYPGYGGYSSY